MEPTSDNDADHYTIGAEEEGDNFDSLDSLFSDLSPLDLGEDCFLSEDLLEQVSTPSQEKWNDLKSSENATLVTIDNSKLYQWDLAKKEIMHVREKLMEDLNLPFEDVNCGAILMHCLGPASKTGAFLQESLHLTAKQYIQFMGTFCHQAAYQVSSTQMYHSESSLKGDTLMSQAEYNTIWKLIANKRKVSSNHISTCRREMPLWEELEDIANQLFKKVSVTGRRGRISIALDDDKVWASLYKSRSSDLFNLKYTTHVQANRKGFILHTAVSTGTNIPLGIVMERSKDSTLQCFERLLNTLFCADGETNLRNVTVHSDRGYMLPALVFEYLIKYGAEVVGTVKRSLQCWPYTFNQTLRSKDRRTLINENGAPTLFLKWTKAGLKYVFASAFRNGSKRVATAISSIHHQHHWEGIALNPPELHSYNKDKRSLRSSFFQRVMDLQTQDGRIFPELEAEKELIEILLAKIEPYTLRQGKISKGLIWFQSRQ